MTLRWIRKRDGRRVPFDVRKLADSVAAAARAAGEEARVPAEEIAEIAALFLERHFEDRIPDTRDLEDLVEKALLETDHSRTAAIYAEHIKARARTRSEITVLRDGGPVAPDGEPLPAPPGERWSEGRIAASLERRRVEPRLADEIAAAVEQKVFALGFRRVPVSLVREIVNAELADRGLSARIGRSSEVALPSEEIRQLLIAAYVRRGTGTAPAAPGGPEAAVGQDVLARFALSEIYPPRVAEAHTEGRIHIQDLGRPLRLTSASISVEALKRRSAVGLDGPRSAGEVGLLLARTVSALLATHARVIGIPYANVFLAPFVRGKEAAARRNLREFVRLIPAMHERPILRLHVAPVPPTLAGAAVLGPRGRRWKATYGELGMEAERCARLLREAIEEEQAARGEWSASGPRLPEPLGIVAGIAESGWLPLGAHSAGATLEAHDLEPQRSRGLAAPAELLCADGARQVIAAGSPAVVAVNCARAAYLASRGDEPAFRRELFAAVDLAIEALAAKWAFLEASVYRPRLPLWESAGAASDASPSDRAAVEPARATQTLALVGFDEALTFITGDPPAANESVARLASELCRDLAQHVRQEGARRSLRMRLEEPELERGSRRLADIDLTRFPQSADMLRLCSPPSSPGDLRYTVGFGATLVDPLYRPLGLAPYLEGIDLVARPAELPAATAGAKPSPAIRESALAAERALP